MDMQTPHAGIRRNGLLLSVLLFLAVDSFVLFALIVAPESNREGQGQVVFVLLCILLGLVLLLPSAYLLSRGRFNFFHPLVFPVFLYLFPAFVLGSLYLQFDPDQSWVLTLVPFPDYYLPLSILYIITGFSGLMVGFALPAAAHAGTALSRHIPAWDWRLSDTRAPCVFLVLAGFGITLYSYSIGIAGYQILDESSLIGGVLNSLGILGDISAFVLWHAYFSRGRTRQSAWLPILGLLIGRVLFDLLFSGSRSALLGSLISILAAYHFSGRQVAVRRLLKIAPIAVMALVLGLNIGTTFRQLKGSEQAISVAETFQTGLESVSIVLSRNPVDNLNYSIDVFLARFETLSSFAVIVANYERLGPIENEYGVANNIWTYAWTSFIPRFIWPDKPKISDARAIGELYFNFPTNSFAMTMFGDLLRNFGPVGIPVGMALLGFVLRVLYVALVENQVNSVWRAVTYYMLLSAVNYESFYGTLFPGWMRIALMCVLSGAIINTLSIRKGSGRLTSNIRANAPISTG